MEWILKKWIQFLLWLSIEECEPLKCINCDSINIYIACPDRCQECYYEYEINI